MEITIETNCPHCGKPIFIYTGVCPNDITKEDTLTDEEIEQLRKEKDQG